MHLFHLSSLLLASALAGCATAVVSLPNAQQQAQARQPQSLLERGHYVQAAQAYLGLATRDRSAQDYFRLRAAEAWRRSGSLDRAAQTLAQVDRDSLQPADAQRYDLLDAAVALKRGDAARTLALTRDLATTLPTALQPRAQALRAQALAATGRPWDAARLRIALDDKLTGTARVDNRTSALALLLGMGSQALQQHASELAPDDPAQHWIAEALAQRGVSVASGAPALSQPVGTLLPGSSQVQGYQLPAQVALVLPLSGPLATAGDALRQGFFASYFEASAHHLLPPVRVYDSAGTPEGSVAAYDQAVANGATLVVGPLTHASVSAVMQVTPLPAALLALNHPDDNALPPARATEFAMRPEVEAAQVARHMYAQGLHQAIVLISDEGFAQRAGKAFETQFTALGGYVMHALTLNPAVIDYADPIASLGVSQPLGNGRDGKRKATPETPSVPPTGLFISMRPPQARLLLPQLHLAGVKLPVFATSHVYGGRDNPVADTDLDGVTFCDAPWLFNSQPGLPSRDALASVLLSARGSSARFFAFGMDAWSLVPYLEWMRTHPGSYLPGASGRLVEDAFGRVHRVLIWARFKNGIAQPLAGSLEMGAPHTEPVPATRTRVLPAAAASSPTHG